MKNSPLTFFDEMQLNAAGSDEASVREIYVAYKQ
jgi:hypothetical protein